MWVIASGPDVRIATAAGTVVWVPACHAVEIPDATPLPPGVKPVPHPPPGSPEYTALRRANEV